MMSDKEIPEGFLDITPNQDKGVFKLIKREGREDEKPVLGSEVSVHYLGTLFGGEKHGQKFDSSRDRAEYFKFKLGKGEVIKAWDIAVATMQLREKCEIICRPEYGYGETGAGSDIPPNASLKFEIELFDWQGEDLSPDSDHTIERTVLDSGEGYGEPKDCSRVEISLEGRHEGRVFDTREVSFEIGDCETHNIPSGVEIALKRMKKGEKSLIRIASKHGLGSKGLSEFKVPDNAELNYIITLKEFEKMKEAWEMKDNEEKLSQSELVKNKGSDYFKLGKLKLAIAYYNKVVDYLQYDSDFSDDSEKSRRRTVLLASHLNLALCNLQLGENTKCIEASEKALEIDPRNDKAFFRTGKAQYSLGKYDDAQGSFQRVLEVDPANKQAKQQIAACQQEMKKAKAQEKALYKTMFTKMAEKSKSEPVAPSNGTTEKPAEGDSA